MTLNTYTVPLPGNFTGNKIEYGAQFCTGTNWITEEGNSLRVKVEEPGVCNAPDAIFEGQEVIE